MSLIFGHTPDAAWFDKATKFDLDQIKNIKADTRNTTKADRWESYAVLLMAKANVSHSADDRNAAITAFEKALSFDLEDTVSLRDLGLLYYERKDYDKAIQSLSAEIRINTNPTAAYLYRAMTYEAKEDYANAVKDYRHATDLEPANAGAFLSLCSAEWLTEELQ
jgi:tetratricopeptide (TPR) repeat protein